MNIGNFLKEERNKKGWRIEDVAEKLKTKKSFITALEEEDFAVLPAKVYLRGLVKKYCEILNAPSKKLLRQLDNQYKDFFDKKGIDELKRGKTRLNHFCLADIKKWIILAIFIVILFYVIFKAEDIFGRPQIKIDYPANNLIVADSEVLVSGSVDGVFKNFSINGQKINISDKGVFKEKIFLKNGVNEIVFSASNLFGKKTEKSIKIINQK